MVDIDGDVVDFCKALGEFLVGIDSSTPGGLWGPIMRIPVITGGMSLSPIEGVDRP